MNMKEIKAGINKRRIIDVCSILAVILVIVLVFLTNGRVARIQQTMVGGYVDLTDIKIEISDSINIGSEYKVFKVDKTISQNQIEQLKEAFDMQGSKEYSTCKYIKDSNSLELHGVNHVWFEGPMDLDYGSDDEVYNAEKFLRDNNLLPEGYEFSSNNDGVFFKRFIDGIEVEGNSIHVEISGSRIHRVSIRNNRICQASKVSIKPLAEAVWELNGVNCLSIKKDGEQIFELDNVVKATIDNAKIVYYADCYDERQNHIQPVYRVEGTMMDDKGEYYTFSTILSALPDYKLYNAY